MNKITEDEILDLIYEAIRKFAANPTNIDIVIEAREVTTQIKALTV